MALYSYLILSSLTVMIVGLVVVLYRRTQHLGFPAGIGLLYYWSLWGGWFLTYNISHGVEHPPYEVLERKLFHIALDGHYLQSLILYGAFIIALELVLLAFVKPGKAVPPQPLRVHQNWVTFVGFVLGILALLMGITILTGAHRAGISAYDYKNGPFATSGLFGPFHLLLRTACTVAGLGIAISASGPHARIIVGDSKKWAWVIQWALFAGLLFYCFVLGSKNLIFSCLITSALFYLANCEHQPRWGKLLGLGVAALLVLGFVNMLRGTPMGDLSQTLRQLSFSDALKSVYAVVGSNEGFAAHYSMYGALHFKIPLLYGGSFVNLILAFIPRGLWAYRPDTYEYYVAQVHADPTTGYTIHHATAWYLNFGMPGVVLGAVIFGGLWVFFYNQVSRSDEKRNRWVRTFAVLSPWMLVGTFPEFVRAGIESYKALALSGILLPVTVLCLAVQGGSSVRLTPSAHNGT